MTGRVAFCADDLGVSVPVSAAIVDLAVRGRLQGVACRTGGEHWGPSAALLRPHLGSVEAGLHLNLTDGAPRSAALAAVWPVFPSLARLRLLAFLGRLPVAGLESELHAQWADFEQQLGRAPDFLSGHEHVHQLPGVRRLVLAAVARGTSAPAVRNTGRVDGPGAAWSRAVIQSTGGRTLQAALRSRGVPHNAALLGVGEAAPAHQRAQMRAWLSRVTPEGALLVCRPGVAGAGEVLRRYLGGRDIAQDLADARVELGPVWRIVGAPAAAR